MTSLQVPQARLLVASAAVIVCAAILWLSRGFNFYFDEWTFILPTDTTWTVYLQPHNEHPVMLTRLIYGVLLNTVGMRSRVSCGRVEGTGRLRNLIAQVILDLNFGARNQTYLTVGHYHLAGFEPFVNDR